MRGVVYLLFSCRLCIAVYFVHNLRHLQYIFCHVHSGGSAMVVPWQCHKRPWWQYPTPNMNPNPNPNPTSTSTLNLSLIQPQPAPDVSLVGFYVAVYSTMAVPLPLVELRYQSCYCSSLAVPRMPIPAHDGSAMENSDHLCIVANVWWLPGSYYPDRLSAYTTSPCSPFV